MIGTAIRTVRHTAYKVSEHIHDWRLGIRTHGSYPNWYFGDRDPRNHGYGPTSYRRFRQLMSRIAIRPDQDVFLDIGSGMGRVVILAACYPFRRTIGIEISSELHRMGLTNIERAHRRMRLSPIETHCVDAFTFAIPAEVTYIYCWNSFSEEILERVLLNVRQSVLAAPRKVTLLYTSPPGRSCLDNVLERVPWLAVQERAALGTGLTLTICTYDGCGE
jgi:SAM-dependent methyltransferase